MTNTLKKNTRLYTDIDLDFTPHPLTGDVPLKTNEDAVKRSIRNLVLYNAYEKPFMPHFGSKVHEMLFENIQSSTASGIVTRVKAMITQYEPRCKLIDVQAVPHEDESRYEVIITFSLKNVLNPITTKIYLQRVR